jgi:TRAP transporter TAXI family solute receptor
MDEHCLQMLCDYLGITYDDIAKWGGRVVHGNGEDMASMVKDGKLDMILDHTSAQSSTMTEIAMTCDVTFLPFEDATNQYFYAHGFQPVTLPANSFKGQTKAIVNAGSPDCLFVRKDLPDDVVYALTKALCENRDALVKQFSSMATFDPKTAWESVKIGGVPLHPGAMKYYKEMGYMPANATK